MGVKMLEKSWYLGMGSVLETDKICSSSYLKSLNNKHGDGLPGQDVPGPDAVLKARIGDSWAPSSPDMNPCDFFFGGLREVVGEQAPPCQPLGPQGEDHQGVQQPARGHGGQG